jgi:glycerophosphoryl diester phosphodiesterase
MHPYFEPPLPHLFAHRGASGEAPENTLEAFDQALASGVAYLEMDCHASADGELVICHDADLARTTDGAGRICDLRYAELAALDAGYRFTPDGTRHPFRGRGLRIPRLADVLERHPQARVNLEVKQSDPPIARSVVAAVQRAGAASRVLLAAENPAVLDAIRALDPGTALGSSRADVIAFFAALDAGAIDDFEPRGHALQIPPQAAGRQLATREAIAAAERLGLFVHVWTIDDPREMAALLELGVHGLMSNHPARLVEVAQRARRART